MFYWVQVWRPARPLQDLQMLLSEPLLSCPCCVFGVIVMLEDPATTHLPCSYWGKEVVGQNLVIHGPIHPPLNTVQSSYPHLQKSTPKAWCFHPHSSRLWWCSWDCTHSSSSSKHSEWRLYQKVIFWSHLTTWPSPMPPLDYPDGLWQTSDGPGHVLAWAGGPCTRCRILIHDSVVCY